MEEGGGKLSAQGASRAKSRGLLPSQRFHWERRLNSFGSWRMDSGSGDGFEKQDSTGDTHVTPLEFPDLLWK